MAPKLNVYQRVAAEGARLLALASWIILLYLAVGHWGGLGWDADRSFNWHPPMMLLGMVVLPINAALTYKTVPTTHINQKYIHAAFHTTSIVMILIGVVAVLKFHLDNGFQNFYSLHSWLGVTVLILFTLQYVAGLVAFLTQLFSTSIRKQLVPLHAFLGIIIAGGGIVVALTGLTEKMSFRQNNTPRIEFDSVENILANVIGLLLLLTLVCALLALVVPSGHEQAIKNLKLVDNDETESNSLLGGDQYSSEDSRWR